MALTPDESRKRHHSAHQRASRRMTGDLDQLLWCPISQAHFMGLAEALMHAAFEAEADLQVDATCGQALDYLALFSDESEAVAVDYTEEQVQAGWLEYKGLGT